MKFPFGSIALLVLILSATTFTSIAQKSDIAEKDFLAATGWKAYRATTARYPRKETLTRERLSDGMVTSSETEITEFLASDKYRVMRTLTSKGKTTTREEIQVGEIRYCKENTSKWEMYCPEPPPAPAMGHIDGAQYLLDEGVESKTYQRTYQYTRDDKEKLTKILFTTVDRIILNKDYSHLDRTIITVNSESKEIVYRTTVKMEYGLKLDPIEAPIK